MRHCVVTGFNEFCPKKNGLTATELHTFSLAPIAKFRSFSTRGESGKYLRQAFLITITPFCGQPGGGFLFSSVSNGASDGRFI